MSAATVMLAIEASQRGGGIALRTRSGDVLAEPFRAMSRHDDDLLPAVDRVVRRASLRPADLACVAVSIGPGGFTGLRIACATAKALAESIGCLLVAVPSALVAAEACSSRGPILVLLAAKRENVWCTRCQRGANGSWEIAGRPGLQDAATIDLTGIDRVLADEHLPPALRVRIEQSGRPIDAPAFAPSDLLLVGERLFTGGHTIDAIELLPLYPREPEAVKVWRDRGR